MRSNRRHDWVPICGLFIALAGGMAGAQQPQATGKEAAYDVLFPRYLQAARQMSSDEKTSFRWMANLGSDFRARDVNDLVTIQVVENITASGSADTNLAKKGSNSASLGKFFGLETKLPSFIDPTNLASPSSSSDFKGSGTTSRTGALTAIMTARVVEVLPNGDLVLEGAREIDINGDRQVIVLTGVVRRVDLAPDNSVSSARVGQLRIRYFGNGLIKDSLKPGWLVRLLNKVF
ncbi:MAG: flagellar basal body L-ring protein FlgH [Acidobacteria bacterium]|nr:flagellar basal body L-ring protein FlgH [Acidobacteriota bacterium]